MEAPCGSTVVQLLFTLEALFNCCLTFLGGEEGGSCSTVVHLEDVVQLLFNLPGGVGREGRCSTVV